MKSLNKKQVIMIHSELIKATGGLLGIRDEGLLDSALASPFQTFDDAELYPGICAKIARLCVGLIKNHPFTDGNKRVGTLTLLILLELNHIDIPFTDDKLIQIGIEVAENKMTDTDLAEWLNQYRL